MFASGLVKEVNRILSSGVSREAHALKAIGYREVVAMLGGECHLSAAVEQTKQSTRKLAKRQLTWLRNLREGSLHWVAPAEENGADVVIQLWDDHCKESGII
jgi:tRNA dimethylallyltransferase